MEIEPKYKVGQKIKVGNWAGETEPLEILNIKNISYTITIILLWV